VTAFVEHLFSIVQDFERFKNYLREFLISLSEFAADFEDLYLEEREQQSKQQQQEAIDKARAIPGLIGPHAVNDMDEF
jgi:hypothetical protein